MLVAIQAFPDSYFSLIILFAVSVARSIHQLAVFKEAGPYSVSSAARGCVLHSPPITQAPF